MVVLVQRFLLACSHEYVAIGDENDGRQSGDHSSESRSALGEAIAHHGSQSTAHDLTTRGGSFRCSASRQNVQFEEPVQRSSIFTAKSEEHMSDTRPKTIVHEPV